MDLCEDDLVSNISKEVVAAGCSIVKKGVLKPSKTGNYIHTLSSKEQKLRKLQVRKLGKFFARDWYYLLDKIVGGRQVKSWLDITDFQINLAKLCNPSFGDWTSYFGIDLCGEDFKVTDFNSDRATILGFQQEIAEIFTKYYPNVKIPKFYDLLIPLIKEITQKKNPNVFILTYINEPYAKPIDNFAKRFGFKVGSINDYNPQGVDLILRQVKSEEIINNLKTYDPLIRSLNEGIPMINPLGSYISGHKGWMTIICALGIMPSKWFPKSWLISGEQVLSSRGEIMSLDNFKKSYVEDQKDVNNRKNFILKKGFGAGGGEVHIGEDLKKYEWENLWSKENLSKSVWVVEEKLPQNNVEICIGEPNESGLEIKRERLNIIERIYSVNNYKYYCGEVFGKKANKVNASGYTFPLAVVK